MKWDSRYLLQRKKHFSLNRSVIQLPLKILFILYFFAKYTVCAYCDCFSILEIRIMAIFEMFHYPKHIHFFVCLTKLSLVYKNNYGLFRILLMYQLPWTSKTKCHLLRGNKFIFLKLYRLEVGFRVKDDQDLIPDLFSDLQTSSA